MTVRTGTAYIHGLKHARGDFIIIMDADLSHHVRSPARLRAWQGCAGVVHLLGMAVQFELDLASAPVHACKALRKPDSIQ